MVSVADSDSLVLMGVDATYCVVDEFDTTPSTFHDVFLQEAIRSGENGGIQLPQYCQGDTPQKITFSSNGFSRQKLSKQTKSPCALENNVTSSDNRNGEQIAQPLAALIPKAESGFESSLLRAALLGSPISFQEPGVSGNLDFCMDSSNSSEVEGLSLSLLKDNKIGTTSESLENDTIDLFRTEPLPKKNIPNARSREKHYQCGVCLKWFGCKSHVIEHMRTHTGEKPFRCPLCNKAFSQKSNIYQHMNTHTLARPFRCEDCGKDFMYRGSLYKHKRLHTGERPYTCGICRRRFTHASQLFEHIRTHTNEKPFKCSVCGRAFAHSGTMHRHKRNHFNCHHSKSDEMVAQKGHYDHSDSLIHENSICDPACLSAVEDENGDTIQRSLKVSLISSLSSSSSLLIDCAVKDTFGSNVVGTSAEPVLNNDIHFQSTEGQGAKVPFRCEICGQVFNYKSSLLNHERQHKQESNKVVLNKNLENKDGLSNESPKHHGMILTTKNKDGIVKSLLTGICSQVDFHETSSIKQTFVNYRRTKTDINQKN